MGAVLSRAAELSDQARSALEDHNQPVWPGHSTTPSRIPQIDGPESPPIDGSESQEQSQNSQEEPEPPETVAEDPAQYDPAPPTQDNNIPGNADFLTRHQKKMLDECAKGDYELAKYIISIDRADPVMNRNEKAPTLKGDPGAALIDCIAVLHTMPRYFKQACITHDFMYELGAGTLNATLPPTPAAAQGDQANKDSLGIPVVYVNLLSGPSGIALTLQQWLTLVRAARRYLKDVVRDRNSNKYVRREQSADDGQWMRSVDEYIPRGKPTSYQYSFSSQTNHSQRKYIQSESELTTITGWCNKVDRRIADIREKFPNIDMDSPVPVVHAGDVGYTYNASQRRWEHENHVRSIPPMNLIDSLARIELGNGYGIHYRNAVYVLTLELVSMTEHVLTRLCCTYVTDGGFNRVAAGAAVAVRTAAKATGGQYLGIQRRYARTFMETFKKEAAMTEQNLAATKDEAVRQDMLKYYERRYRERQQTIANLNDSKHLYKEALGNLDGAADRYIEGAEKQLNLFEEAQKGVQWCKDAEEDIETVWLHYCRQSH